MKRFSIVLIAGAVAAIAAAGLQGANLTWKPKVGTVNKYKITTRAQIMGQEMNFAATLTSKVLEVTGEKVVVEETQSEISLKVGDQDFSSMVPASMKSTNTMKLDGTIIDRKSEMEGGDNPRMEAAMEARLPNKVVEKGGTWSFERAANAEKKVPASKTTYTYVDDEKVGKFDTWKITFVFKETEGSAPMEVTGTMWVDQATGDPVKATYKMKNVEFQEGTGTTDAEAEMTRID